MTLSSMPEELSQIKKAQCHAQENKRRYQDTCFHCCAAREPEVEAMTFGTRCKIQLLTQLFSAGVRKGRMIYCICFVEVDDFFGVHSSFTG